MGGHENYRLNHIMIVRARFVLIAAILLAASILGSRSIRAQDEPSRYFPETGHVLSGEFLAAYESIPNPELIYGAPITEAFPRGNGSAEEIQYFENAVLIYDPAKIHELRVRRVEVGSLIEKPETRISLPYQYSPTACRTFSFNQIPVCYAFLDFYEAHGGISRFGEPISEFEIHSNRIVQYFQFARFEWHPELPTGGIVTLTPLGREYFEQQGEAPWRLRPVIGNNIPKIILKIRVRAYPADAVTNRQGEQTVFFLVQDQNRHPVENARVEYTVKFPSGKSLPSPMPVFTDDNGMAKAVFDIDGSQIGLVEINVTATHSSATEQITDQALTSFRIWW